MLTSCGGGAGIAPVKLNTQADSISYTFGTMVGMNMKQNVSRIEPLIKADFNYDNFLSGLKTAMEDTTKLEMPLQDARMYFMTVMQKLEAQQMAIEQAKRDSAAAVNLEKGTKFLEENAKKEGVVTLENGIQYIVLEEGKGKKPTIDDVVEIDYEGTLIDGTKFDSSIDRGEPAKFPLKNLIKGWQEAIPLMPVGSKWKIFIPAEMGYGAQDRPGIPGNSVLIFDVKLHQIIKK
ncbi:MAG: FKBP-type peptidyl-prolyl cis-trans isomerase [Bacteroidales bacterium]|nr:FKBP-type peptidyl-prolyl cis-trans isomerase [Bacteroidales bacterium]